MKKKNIKKIIVLSIALIMILGTAAITAGQVTKRNIEATYGRVKFTYNGKDITKEVESKYGTPGFIAEDRSYVPVRAIADILGVDVNWDQNTSTAHLTSSSANTQLLQQQIAYRDAEIARLTAENERLKDGRTSDGSISLRDLESRIIRDYDSYEGIDFDIRLRGDDRKVDLEVQVNLRNSRDRDRWDDLRERDIERFIDDMIRDIQREYRDADVEGYIRDTDERKDLWTFDKRRNGSLNTNNKDSSSSSSTRTIERDVERRYSDALKDIKDMTFIVTENRKDEYEFTVEVDYDKYEREWDRLAYSEIKTFLDNVADYIEGDIRNSEVVRGEIVKERDGRVLDTYRR